MRQGQADSCEQCAPQAEREKGVEGEDGEQGRKEGTGGPGEQQQRIGEQPEGAQRQQGVLGGRRAAGKAQGQSWMDLGGEEGMPGKLGETGSRGGEGLGKKENIFEEKKQKVEKNSKKFFFVFFSSWRYSFLTPLAPFCMEKTTTVPSPTEAEPASQRSAGPG